jgi:hypothetical protein
MASFHAPGGQEIQGAFVTWNGRRGRQSARGREITKVEPFASERAVVKPP